MKRTVLTASILSLGLFAWTAQGQQTNNQQPNNQQQNPPAATQPNTQPGNPSTTQNPRPATGTQTQQNTQLPNTGTQQNTQAPNPNVNSQPNVNVNAQPGTTGTAVGAQANTAQSSGTMVNGRVVRVGQDQFVLQGTDNKQYTFYTNPQSTYWMNNNPAQYSNLQVGSNVSTWYVPQGERYFVSRVNMLPAGAAFPVQDATTTTTAQPTQAVVPQANANTNAYQGEVIRVGNNQVVIRTSDGKEIIVYTTPQTTYQLNEQPATFTQLQPGVPVRVDYDLRDQRPYARGIFGRRR